MNTGDNHNCPPVSGDRIDLYREVSVSGIG